MPVVNRFFLFIGATLLFTGCAVLLQKNYDVLYGTPNPKEFQPARKPLALDYQTTIRPVLESRCVVCHACYDAPCQLKMESYDGLLRGASPARVYNGERLITAVPTRLFQDAHTTAGWRKLGFHPVLNERVDTTTANLDAGLMAQMLELKIRHPSPDTKVLPETFDFSITRKQECPSIETFADFANKKPLWGMPFGLPELPGDEYKTLRDWLAQGAPTSLPQPLTAPVEQAVVYWEGLFNGDSLRHQLVARYVFEHLYLAHLYFIDAGTNTSYFRIVRSTTPPGQPIERIVTLRPYDPPGVDTFYYRLLRNDGSVVAKTHMPYALTEEKRAKWHEWFFDPVYDVTSLPDYGPSAANPFITFQAIPIEARHKFLLDEAQFTIMNFIKGPVCRGSMALNVIQDHFWVFFAAPNTSETVNLADFLAIQQQHLTLPAASESGLWSITDWRHYAKSQQQYLTAKGDLLRSRRHELAAEKINLVWDGHNTNPNAALTIFRHFDSASVVKGLVGQQPKTVWIIDYPVLERIHYLLVAGFDVFGTGSHQAMTRLYMDFLRMESEMNFLAFLPEPHRSEEVDNWYLNAHNDVDLYLDAYFKDSILNTALAFKTDNPKRELLDYLSQQVRNATRNDYALEKSSLPAAAQTTFAQLQTVDGNSATHLPQTVYVHVKNHGVFTILNNSAYTNVSSMFNEADRRLPTQDNLTVINGIIGAYPNVLFDIAVAEIPEFVEMISDIEVNDDYIHLLDRFAVRRTNNQFWSLSDKVHQLYRQQQPLNAGILDYNRLDNR